MHESNSFAFDELTFMDVASVLTDVLAFRLSTVEVL